MDEIVLIIIIVVSIGLCIVVLPLVILGKIGELRRRLDRQVETFGLNHRRIVQELTTLQVSVDELAKASLGAKEGPDPEIGDEAERGALEEPPFAPERVEKGPVETSLPLVGDGAALVTPAEDEAAQVTGEGIRTPGDAPVPVPTATLERGPHRAPEREKSRFEKAALETLQKTWN